MFSSTLFSSLHSFAMYFPCFSTMRLPCQCRLMWIESGFSDIISIQLLFLFLFMSCLIYQCLSNITLSPLFHIFFAPVWACLSNIQTVSIAEIFIFFSPYFTSHLSDPLFLLLVLFSKLFLPYHLIVSLWISLSLKSPFVLLGLFFPLCYTISPSFMLSFIFMLNLPLYICAHSLCLSFCSAPVVRPYEMNWYKWHFMGLCSTTRLNTAGNHKSHCLLRMPLLMCSIWFNASNRWGKNRKWGLRGEVERELRVKNGDKRDK